MQLVHMFRIPRLKGIVGVILYMLRVPYLLEKGEGMSNLGRRMKNIPESKGVSMEEFLDDISKSKRKYSYALP